MGRLIVFVRFALPAMFLALPACGVAEATRANASAMGVVVTVASVHEEPFHVLYRASGTVRGRNTATLTSRTSGYVRRLDVRAGDRVKTGDVLVVLEANDVAASVRRASAGLDQALQSRTEAEHALDAARIAARNAKTTLDRAAKLLADGAIPKQQFDDVEAAWRTAAAQEEVALARVRVGQAGIDVAQAGLGESQATLGYARIAAPFNGRVIERRVDPGNLATPGMPLLVLEQEGQLRVEAAVAESRAGSFAIGDVVEVDASPTLLSGRVSEIVPNVDVASRAFVVKVDLPADAVGLRPGMFARVSFHAGTRTKLVVARDAVVSFGALDRVFVIDGDRARLRMVTIGDMQGPVREVLSGLSAGDRVVAAPPPELSDGARVEVKP